MGVNEHVTAIRLSIVRLLPVGSSPSEQGQECHFIAFSEGDYRNMVLSSLPQTLLHRGDLVVCPLDREQWVIPFSVVYQVHYFCSHI